MGPIDFFVDDPKSAWGELLFDLDRVTRLRSKPEQGVSDLENAYQLACLTQDELLKYGTGGGNRLTDDELRALLRTLRAVLGRLEIDFDVPFRDFAGFHTYWKREGMSYSYAARREYLSGTLDPIIVKLERMEEREFGRTIGIKGVNGGLRNIIFASTGAKPRIVIRDAIDNVIDITDNAELCLFYDRPLGGDGLFWSELVDWWQARPTQAEKKDEDPARSLYRRLAASLESPPERLLFRTYCQQYSEPDGASRPALLPQVYLHYDPYTRRARGGRPGPLRRERMDFLLLLPGGIRIVIEVDGKQHYAEGEAASPRLYSEMVAEDRKLRLSGYEVYRFGGWELHQNDAADTVRRFFDQLLKRHRASDAEPAPES